jgi:hypothetical protein
VIFRRCPRNCKQRVAVAKGHWSLLLREGQTAAQTCEPGDLPKHDERPRAGCPDVSLAMAGAKLTIFIAMRALDLAPQHLG